jgi:integrase
MTTPTVKGKGKGKYKIFRNDRFSLEKLKKYKEIQTWLRTVSESSRIQYLHALRNFCEFCGKNPKELILMRDKEIRNPDPNTRTGVRDLVLDFRVYLEKEGYAPKTINAWDGAVRSFFSSILGKAGMINVKNYRNACITKKKDFVPTLEELKKMIEVCNLEEKFRIIFLAQTGMRISDALDLKVSDVLRELELNRIPLAITYVPKKDRDAIGERITFLATDGVEILKQYLEWRKKNGEKITPKSPLFVGRSRKYNGIKITKLTRQMVNLTLKEAIKKAGLGNGNGKYGRIRVHCLRKFFVTQLTNHGVEDKIVNFFIGHKIPEVDRVYWFRRVEQLREIYRQRKKFLNPISGTQHEDLRKIEDLIKKVKELDEKLKSLNETRIKEIVFEVIKEYGVIFNSNNNNSSGKYDVKIITSEEEIVKLAKRGYDCQRIGKNKWLMKKEF